MMRILSTVLVMAATVLMAGLAAAQEAGTVLLRYQPGWHLNYSLTTTEKGTDRDGRAEVRKSDHRMEVITRPQAEGDRLTVVVRKRWVQHHESRNDDGSLHSSGRGGSEKLKVMNARPDGTVVPRKVTAQQSALGKLVHNLEGDVLLDMPLPDEPVQVGATWQKSFSYFNPVTVKLAEIKDADGHKVAVLEASYSSKRGKVFMEVTADFDIERGIIISFDRVRTNREPNVHHITSLDSATRVDDGDMAALASTLSRAVDQIAQGQTEQADETLGDAIDQAPERWHYALATLRYRLGGQKGDKPEFPYPPREEPAREVTLLNGCNTEQDIKAFSADGMAMSLEKDWKVEGAGSLRATMKGRPPRDKATIVCRPAKMPPLRPTAHLLADLHSGNVQFASFEIGLTDGETRYTSPVGQSVAKGEQTRMAIDLAKAAKAGVDLGAVTEIHFYLGTGMFVEPGSVVHIDAVRVKEKDIRHLD